MKVFTKNGLLIPKAPKAIRKYYRITKRNDSNGAGPLIGSQYCKKINRSFYADKNPEKKQW